MQHKEAQYDAGPKSIDTGTPAKAAQHEASDNGAKVNVTCPACEKLMRLPILKKVDATCPHCRQVFRVSTAHRVSLTSRIGVAMVVVLGVERIVFVYFVPVTPTHSIAASHAPGLLPQTNIRVCLVNFGNGVLSSNSGRILVGVFSLRTSPYARLFTHRQRNAHAGPSSTGPCSNCTV
jgi:RNase P subunit RPR2